jgi:rubredoxin
MSYCSHCFENVSADELVEHAIDDPSNWNHECVHCGHVFDKAFAETVDVDDPETEQVLVYTKCPVCDGNN